MEKLIYIPIWFCSYIVVFEELDQFNGNLHSNMVLFLRGRTFTVDAMDDNLHSNMVLFLPCSIYT